MVFPKTCLGCGRTGSYICTSCLSNVKLAKPICPYCERPSIDGVTHVKCQTKLGLNGLISIWEYDGVIKRAILALKYKYATEIATLLNSFIIEKLKSRNFGFTVPNSCSLVPIPLHWHRQNVRGFNQSIEVGKSIAGLMGWNFLPELLIKKQQTISQVELKGDERRHNLKGVFEVNPNYVLNPSYSVLLFDDVFTTGSTLHEAAKVLKRAGGQKVWGLTIAR